jgi:fucose 4-O-acetylase-like acetyltransferase
MKTSRWAWADIAKGIAILLVVINHAAEGILEAGIGTAVPFWKAFHDICYTFHVPVFFFLSGWLSQASSKKPLARAKALLTNIVYPYLVWSILQSGVMIVAAAGNIVPQWSRLPWMLWSGSFQFWFLHCLILIMLIDLTMRTFQLPTWGRLCGAVCLTSYSVLGHDLPWKFNAVAENIIYFEVGIALATVATETPRSNIYAMAFSGAVLLFTFWSSGAGYPTNLKPIGAFSGIMFCLASSSIIANSKGILRQSLEFCGRYSLQIFAAHLIFTAGLRVVLQKLGVETFWIQFSMCCTAGILLPLALAIFDERYLTILFRLPDFKRTASTNVTARVTMDV